jgi:hypothetical protein
MAMLTSIHYAMLLLVTPSWQHQWVMAVNDLAGMRKDTVITEYTVVTVTDHGLDDPGFEFRQRQKIVFSRRVQTCYTVQPASLSRNKSWRLGRGWNVGLPSLRWHLAQPGRHNCQLYAPAALYPQGKFLVLTSVRGWVDPRTTECVQELGHLKISKDPTGNQTRGLPLCGTVPQPNAPPLAPFNENRSYFPGLNRPGRELISCPVWVELYLCSPYTFMTWTGKTLPFRAVICRGLVKTTTQKVKLKLGLFSPHRYLLQWHFYYNQRIQEIRNKVYERSNECTASLKL